MKRGSRKPLEKSRYKFFFKKLRIMKKLKNLGTPLTLSEQMKIVGGTNCHCTCSGGGGWAWVYNYEPSGATIASDISTHCSTGAATCGGCSNIY
jgi:hypothetical protein